MKEKRNIRIKFKYDGSNFYGFQRQPKKRTVQGEIEKSLMIIVKESITLISSGRTDRNVHALMQVSNFYITNTIPIDRLKIALNNLLPDDIELLELEVVPIYFNSRYMALSRTYLYKIRWNKNIFLRKYYTFTKDKLNIENIKFILDNAIGKHDFNNFRLSDCNSTTSIREIFEIKYIDVEGGVDIYISGNAFLKSQIRIIIGIMLDEYYGRVKKGHFKEMLECHTKQYQKNIAPASGLYLYDVNYNI